MAFRLDLARPAPDALRLAADAQLADAVAQLRETHATDPVEAVHDARKDLKKTRSLLRLARRGMPRKARRRANAELRDIAASLSRARDADAIVATVDDLAARYAGQLPASDFDALRSGLADRAGAEPGADVAAAADRLAAAQAAVAEWPLSRCTPVALADGAAEAYARGRAAFRRAEEDASVEHLHDWRKRVKDLWYHSKLLGEAWPGVLDAQATEAHRLADLLGDDHDLAVLSERTDADDPVAPLVAQRREELEREAFSLGRRLYAERPKDFASRLRSYVRAAAADAPALAQTSS